MKIQVTVNGTPHDREVEPRTLLVHFLREQLGLTATNVGCDTSSCGACTVHLDGEAVKSCTVLAVQADGKSVLAGWSWGTDNQIRFSVARLRFRPIGICGLGRGRRATFGRARRARVRAARHPCL